MSFPDNRHFERYEDAALLKGAGSYIDDYPIKPGTLYAAILRSPSPHASIKSINIDKAVSLPGVRAVLTSQDAAAWSKPLMGAVKSEMKQFVLAVDRVRYVGEPMVVVVAESRAIAEDGVELIDFDLEPLAAITDVKEAISSDAILLHGGTDSNCVSDRVFSYGEPDRIFENAAHLFELDISYPRNSCTPIETTGVIAEWIENDNTYEVTSNFMGPFSLHTVMAAALGVSGVKLRHKVPKDSGGSFGVKQSALPYVVLTCLASRKAGAPVKFIEDRLEHLVAATSATARTTHIRAAVDENGKILALDYDQLEDCGAYLRAPEPATLYRMHGCLTGAYDIPHLKVRNRVILLNKTPTGLVRGFGGPQVYFALERLVFQIAKSLGKSYLEIAGLNYVKKYQFPFKAAAGAVLDSGDYDKAVSILLHSPEYQDMLDRQIQARKEGKWYGIGYASIVEPSVSNMGYISTVLSHEQRQKSGHKNGAIASATVSVDPTGSVLVNIASAPAGQGHQTVIKQIVSEVFGLSGLDVVVNVDFDTNKDAWSVAAGNYSSRFAGAVAGTVHIAATRLKEKISSYAATLLETSEDSLVFQKGYIINKDSDAKILFARACGAFHWAPDLVAAAIGSDRSLALRETAFWSASTLSAPDSQDHINTSAAYGFVLDACGIEIDPITCKAVIDRYVTVHDAGKILNPLLADGQIYGAFSQAVGAALFEEFQYSSDGNFLSGTFADYRVPTAVEVPIPSIKHMESPSPFTPLGAKGIGEGNSMSTPVCIGNAIADAINYEGIDLPATPPKIHGWLVQAGHLKEEPTRQKSDRAHQKNMPLQASGEIKFGVEPGKIFEVLLDPQRIKKIIPGCESISQKKQSGDIVYESVAVVRIGVMKARFHATIVLSDINIPHGLTLSGYGKGPLGLAEGAGAVDFTTIGGVTHLSYHYQARVSGKLSAVGSRLLEGAIRLVLDQLFKALAREAGDIKTASLWKRLVDWILKRAKPE